MNIKYKLKDIMDDEIQSVLDMATKAHEGQLRLDGEPYIIHPIMVAELLIQYGGTKLMIKKGLCHDLIEDTDWTYNALSRYYGKPLADGVSAVTNDDEEKVRFPSKGAYLVHKMSDLEIEDFVVKLADVGANLITLVSGTLRTSFVKKSLNKTKEILEAFDAFTAEIDPRYPDLSIRELWEDVNDLYYERLQRWTDAWDNEVPGE